MGLPALGLSLDGHVDVLAGYDLRLIFGLDRALGFYIDTTSSEEVKVSFAARLPNTMLAGRLGLLTIRAEDDGTDPSLFAGTFTIDLLSPHASGPAAGRLTLADVQGGLTDGALAAGRLSASARLRLKIAASFSEEASFPRLRWDLAVDWTFSPGQPDLTGGVPAIAFNNVQLSLGEFFSRFVQPILEVIQSVSGPLQPLVDVLGRKLPLLDKSLIDLAEQFGQAEGGALIKALAGVVELANKVPTSIGDDVYLNMGSFDLGGANIKGRENLHHLVPNVTEVRNPVAQLDSISRAFIDEAKDVEESGVGLLRPADGADGEPVRVRPARGQAEVPHRHLHPDVSPGHAPGIRQYPGDHRHRGG
jgi:hypothetical protein